MPKTYEATLENGVLKWLNKKPDITNGVRVKVIVDTPDTDKRDEEIQKVLESARGAWGTHKTLEEVENKIKEIQKENWSRE